MSEMLGNRYFIARQFEKAIPHLEQCLFDANDEDKIKKKLIICYIQVGRIDSALSYFFQLIKKDPDIFLETDPYFDDCPCYELIPEYERTKQFPFSSVSLELVLGMLYLYCNLEKSIHYFELAQQDPVYSKKVASILRILIRHQKSIFS